MRTAFYDHWHYHSELEIVYIIQGEGTRFIGDDISRFSDGDLVLLGSGLPHVWKSNDNYFDNNLRKKVSAIVLHFGHDFLGKGLWDLPEMIMIKKLLELSLRGICYHLPETHLLKRKIREMLSQKPFDRLINLLTVLHELAHIEERTILSSISFAGHYQKHHSKRIDKIYDYILSNFEKNIKLEELAILANMTPASLCRFFRQKTRKSVSEFINEVRIGYACKLLIEGTLSISEVCFRCGYDSLSYFNRKFKRIVGQTPGSYQKNKYLFEKKSEN